MNELTEFMSPQEAWDELLSERNTYIRRHKAAYSGLHMELTATAFQDSFWNRHGKAKIHVPLAADIAAVSSDLLFGNAPRCKIYDDSKESEEDDKQNRLDQILRGSKFESVLQEAAETAAVIGDVYLKCNWDSKALPCPSICYVSGEDAVPEYRFAKLVCVHFFTIIKQDRKTGRIWRLYERYEPGHIWSMVYTGDTGTLGVETPSGLEVYGVEEHVAVPGGGMLAVHIANMKPSRVRQQYYGRSEFEGMRDMLDSLDEAWSSWMRDIRLAKARIIVPQEYLRPRNSEEGGGGGQMFTDNKYTFEFDEDVEVYVALDIANDKNMTITPSQFAIRSAEHAATVESLIRNIISMGGYSPQTFGLDINGQATSGTALLIREKKTYQMRSKKLNYWSEPLESFLTAVLHLDAEVYHIPNVHPEDRVIVEFPDSMSTDISTMAQAVQMMHNAQAVSVRTAIKMLHPDWEDGQIEEEAERCMQEFGTPDPSAIAEEGDLHPDQDQEDGDA